MRWGAKRARRSSHSLKDEISQRRRRPGERLRSGTRSRRAGGEDVDRCAPRRRGVAIKTTVRESNKKMKGDSLIRSLEEGVISRGERSGVSVDRGRVRHWAKFGEKNLGKRLPA